VELERIFASDVDAVSIKSPESALTLQLKCVRCASDFQGEEELKAHILLGVCQTEVQKTSVEKNKFEIQPASIPLKTNRIRCFMCLKMLGKSSLSMHMKNIHKSIIRCKILSCVSYFYTEAERLEHEVQVHKVGQWTKCNYCENWFENRHKHCIHITKYHKDIKAIKCDFHGQCSEIFYSKSEKDKHILQVHKNGHIRRKAYINVYMQKKKLSNQRKAHGP
jgi:hypothetical protein